MTYAAASEGAPPEYVQEASVLVGLRSELSVPGPSAGDEMEESDASSHVHYIPINRPSRLTPRR
eukprot:4350155-Alexandrium_andersonii.AAC.1